MGDWGNIPSEIAMVIAEHMEKVEDLEALELVCSSWRRGAKEIVKSVAKPWLILPRQKEYGTNQRTFYSLYNRKVRTANLPVRNPNNAYQVYLFSSHGWLLSVTDRGNNLFLLNPMSGAKLSLPKVTCFVQSIVDRSQHVFRAIEFHKFILSGNPADGGDFTVALLMTYPDYRYSCSYCYEILCFWRDGYEQWRTLLTERFTDVCFYKGNFYGVGFEKIWCYELDQHQEQEQSPGRRVVAKITGSVRRCSFRMDSPYYWCSMRNLMRQVCYLVESENRLLLVIRVRLLVSGGFRTLLFRVYEVNVDNGEIKDVPKLGDVAIFVGWNSSFSAKASLSHGIKPNSIYFSGDYRIDGELDFGHGIFHLADDNVHQLDDIINQTYHCEHAPYVWFQDPTC